MPAPTSDRESCRKRGVILACYVDGHKRFRAAPLGCKADGTDLDAAANQNREAAPDAAVTIRIKPSRPN